MIIKLWLLDVIAQVPGWEFWLILWLTILTAFKLVAFGMSVYARIRCGMWL